VSPETRPIGASRELLERARRVIPGATQTLSKGPSQWVQGVAPSYITRGEGAYVFDVDGNRYLDFPMSLGPVILGHGHPAVTEAIERQLRDGIVFTLPHPIEVELAERVVERIPGAEQVRFAKTGSDVDSAAVRVARAHTGRERIVIGGYHGWHDWYIGSTSRNTGVPVAVSELVDGFTFNDLDSLDAALGRHPGEIAAVILEPAGAEEPAPGFLEGVIERSHSAGALVIFDEIITGFRVAPGGAQERYDVRADLATFGKALGNGMPISALAGRAEVMGELDRVFFSGTHGGETLSMAAALAVLDTLDESAYRALDERGEQLRAGIEGAIESADLADWVTIGGTAPWTVVQVREPGDDPEHLPAKSVLQQELLRRGVLFNGSNFISLAHTAEDIDAAIAAYAASLQRLAEGMPDDPGSLLEGEPLSPAFRPLA
jgi:glutamate-1-semialdehyde aminotransferase